MTPWRPSRFRISLLEGVVGSILLAWGAWMVLEPGIARRERMRAMTNLYVQQYMLLNECAAKQASETRFQNFLAARYTAKAALGPAAHQDIDRLCNLTDDFVMIYTFGRTAKPSDQITEAEGAIIIPALHFTTPIRKQTNQTGTIWVPNAHQVLSQATANLTETLFRIASK